MIAFTDILTNIKKNIWKNKFSLVMFIALLFLSYTLTGKVIFAFVNIISLFFLFNVLAKTKYTFLISTILVVFISTDIVYYLLYSGAISLGVFSSIFETTPNEAKGMFGELYKWIIPVFLIVIFVTVKMIKEMKNNNLGRTVSFVSFVIVTLVLIPAYFCFNLSREKNIQAHALFSDSPMLWGQVLITYRFPVVYNNCAISVSYLMERLKIKKLLNADKKIPEGIDINTGVSSVDRIYIIIGESSFRGHYSLFGYDVDTTPFLDSLKLNTNQLHYYNAISPAPITRDAIRFSLSFGTPLNKDAFFTKKNIIELAKDKGYETIWISNQERVGSFDNYTGILSSTSDKTSYPTRREEDRKDLDLIKELAIYSKPLTKQLILLHLSGSHMPYGRRFDAVDKIAIPINHNGEQTITDYDRTIHYTDRVLEAVYNYSMKQDEQSLIYYFSDHGECVGRGHGLINIDKEIEQFEIPLVVINNNTEIQIDSLVNKYKQPNLGVVNNSNSVYILSEILGYRVSSNLIHSALNDGQYVYHVDGRTYRFNEIK